MKALNTTGSFQSLHKILVWLYHCQLVGIEPGPACEVRNCVLTMFILCFALHFPHNLHVYAWLLTRSAAAHSCQPVRLRKLEIQFF